MRSVQLTVIRAQNLPRLKTFVGKQRLFYATVTYRKTTWRTKSVQSVAQIVEWNETLEMFAVQPLPRITVSLYAEKTRITREDILIGTQDIACDTQRALDIVFGRTDGNSGHETEFVTLSLTITVSANTSPSTTAAINVPNPTPSDLDEAVDESSTGGPTNQLNSDIMQPMAANAPLSSLSQGGTPVQPMADGQTSITLDRAEEAMDAMKSWKTAVSIIKQVMDHVSPIVELFPPAKSAWMLLSKVPETLLHQFNRDDNIQNVLHAIRDAFEFAKEADALTNMEPASTQAKLLVEMLDCVSECARFIISYAEDVQVGTRTLKNAFGNANEKVEQYRTTLVRLRDNFLARASVIIEIAVLESGLDAKIRELPYKGGWKFDDDQKRCLPGTRKDFLQHIIKWAEDPKSKHGLVLLGQAGTGKSSIAHEVARHFEHRCLGSYFTFLRKEGSKDDAYQLFTTVARDLSDRYPSFKLALGKIVKDDTSLRSSRGYRTLFKRLLLEPLRSLQYDQPILIVIDGLDESGDAIGQTGLHVFLAEHLLDLPSNFRVFITSRPEDGIGLTFTKASSVDTMYMDDAKLAAKTEEDIRIYLQKVLRPDVFEVHGAELAKAAEGLFQWAAVASGFINNPDSLGLSIKRRVQRLLGHSRGLSGEGLLDNLYEEVLKQYFKSEEAQALFRSVMGQLLAAIKPLSIHSLIGLRRHSPAPVDDPEESDSELVVEILSHLGSLLSNVTPSDQMRPIIPLHTSFRDFLTNRTSNVFYVDLEVAHHHLAYSCLGFMLDNLKFNICRLETSYLANKDVPDLDSRIGKYIPPALSYACVSWGNHLEHVAFDGGLFGKLKSLFEKKFLFWLEVLSLKSNVGLASRALTSVSKWLKQERSRPESENLLALVNDASAFVRYFGMAVAKSAPHIYTSALPFAPSSSLVLNHYFCRFPQTLSVERGQLSRWPALEMTIRGHNSWVTCVAFSPDGQRIASSGDSTVRVWDAATGDIVAGPFTPGFSRVKCVAFSPDGHRIASASYDTIRVWDIATGEAVVGSFTGHYYLVNSVAFSPDGQRIASTSCDRTIRVWDAATGKIVAGPFTRHIAPVRSVAFSPDGRRIASASEDYTICLWDVATGEVVAGPLIGHTFWVNCVTFSPDGRRIASASNDHTIRVWDAATGEIVVGPFTGHTKSVNSVAFSPDGHRIASASDDHTIRVWDARTGETVAGPFTGHTSWVLSVAFSPDGNRIASASEDHTICLWDASAGEFAAHPFTEDKLPVRSIAFSPDGTRIASATFDHSIRVWDAATGELEAYLITGHTDYVDDVAFSPDSHRIASASCDHTVRVWDAETGEIVADPFTGHTKSVHSVAFSPDGQRIASSSRDRTIRVWDATTGQVVAGPFTAPTDSLESVAFSLNGQIIASALVDYSICVWYPATGEVVAGPITEDTHLVKCVALSHDGQRIASSHNNTFEVWNVATGELIAGPFTGHTKLVTSVVFSPDGHRIASVSHDHAIRVWDAATGDVISIRFARRTDLIQHVAFSPCGEYLVSGSNGGEIRMEKIATEDIHALDQFLTNHDGWVCGKDGELLFWIPVLHRPCQFEPSTVWISGRQATRLDLSKFVHGSNWATVHDHRL